MSVSCGWDIYDVIWASGGPWDAEEQEEAMDCYEYVMIMQPTDEEREKGKLPYVMDGPEVCIASDKEKVREIAASRIPEECREDINRIRILVRPFA